MRCRRYGMDTRDFAIMVGLAGSCCAICRRKVSPLKLNIDHDHERGHVRGLLCTRCNTALGVLGLDGSRVRERIEALVRYFDGSASGTMRHATPKIRTANQSPQVVDTSAEQDYPARLASPDE